MPTTCKACNGTGQVGHTRKSTAERKQEILDAAITIARKSNYRTMKRIDIATAAGCSPSLVTPRYFSSMDELRDAVMREAIRRELSDLVLQGLIAKDPIATELVA